MLESIVLGMVLEWDLTGYEIKKLIESTIGIFYKASFGSLYPALKRLTVQGCLTTAETAQGGRRKIAYHITESGKARFFEWLSSPTEILEGSNTHLAKVYFFDRLPRDTRERQLLSYELCNRNYLKKLRDLEREFQGREDFYYKLSTLYYGICITEKTIEWCEQVRLQRPLKDLVENGGEA